MNSKSAPLDCQEAARRLHELLDNELTPEVEAAVRQHLEDCADCMAVLEFEEAFKRFVALRAKSTTAPADLKQRILGQLDLSGPSPDE
jgi:anti-sigma factor (TIGR02949 family)